MQAIVSSALRNYENLSKVFSEQKLGNEATNLHAQIYFAFMLCIYNSDLYTFAVYIGVLIRCEHMFVGRPTGL